jgi:hypothetical protein
MSRGELESERESLERAVELLERLAHAADGGRAASIGQYEASTLLALLEDERYRAKVMVRFAGVVDVDLSARP